LKPHAPDARSSAAWALDRILGSKSPADRILSQAALQLSGRDTRLLQELVMGCLRWLRRLDQVIATASSRRWRDIDSRLWSPLRVGAYQLLFLDRIPAHAAVDQAVDEAGRRTHRRGAGFTNAVMRSLAQEPHLEAWPVSESDAIRRLAVETSHPDFLVRRWLERFGDERTRRLLAANNRVKPLHLLAFGDRGGRQRLIDVLASEDVLAETSAVSPLGLTVKAGEVLRTQAFERGDFYIQDEASQLAALVPPPAPGERVLDVAAAPGGKTFALLAAESSTRVVAADLNLSRLRTLHTNVDRLRCEVPTLVADGLALPFKQSFHRVVLDAPCTGSGTLRKNPELKWRISETEIQRLGSLGANLIRSAADCVSPKGLLVVITCSLEPEENELVVESFLSNSREFELVPLASELPSPQVSWAIGSGLWRILPGGDHDGFTVQVLRRN
jgi:16S rRNA (cytosine967-C5)-methyltransferase